MLKEVMVKVGLEILDNRTEKRGHEFDLSALLAREMIGAGIVVNAPEAPVKLVGEIVNFDQPGVVEKQVLPTLMEIMENPTTSIRHHRIAHQLETKLRNTYGIGSDSPAQPVYGIAQ